MGLFKPGKPFSESSLLSGTNEGIDRFIAGHVVGSVPGNTGFLSNRQQEVCFTDTRGTQKEHILFTFNEGEAFKLLI